MNKNSVKLRKALLTFYCSKENIIYLLRDFKSFKLLKKINYDEDNSLYLKLYNRYDDIFFSRKAFNVIKTESTIKKYLLKNKIIYTSGIIENIRENVLDSLDKTNESKLPNTDLELVFSANFADFFLCSTSEKWTSCLNLESDYSYSYWAGIPAFITDKNKILVYLTDGRKKEYLGIQSERMIARNWMFLTKDIKNEKKYYFINRGYPNDFSSLIKNYLKKWCKKYEVEALNAADVVSEKIYYQTVHPIPFLWHNVINDSSSMLNRNLTIDVNAFIDNGVKEAIDKDTYSINNYSKRSLEDFFYLKQHEEIKNFRFARFNYKKGLQNLEESYDYEIGKTFFV